MLSKKYVCEIIEHLEKAQNPVFLYDNDADGLCSYVLFRRFLGRGKGVAIRTYPEIDAGYAKKVQDLGADYVFVLDKPFLGSEFLSELEGLHLPIVWIDHHLVDRSKYKYSNLFVYNSADKNGNAEPVTALAYQITERSEDMWIAMMGCIADHFWPSFSGEFSKRYPEFWKKFSGKKPFDIYYKSEIGLLARAIGFGLKDSVSHVVYLQNLLISSAGPENVLSDLESGSSFGLKYREMRDRYNTLISEAKSFEGGKLVFFKYAGTTSMSSDIANELSYRNPKSYVIVAYQNGALSNLSLRGKNIRRFVDKILARFPEARGGGHENAVGIRLYSKDLENFESFFREQIKTKV